MAEYPDFDRADGLLPAIAQDDQTGQVLMLAWMNRQAFEETVATGWATYFSRSKQRLWRKGETSGHRQRVKSILVDCDQDAILLKVEQAGAACHKGFRTCFFRQWQDGQYQTVEPRLVDPESVYGKTNHD
jgi:phosphoribosyl-AMP cyclohydrolase